MKYANQKHPKVLIAIIAHNEEESIIDVFKDLNRVIKNKAIEYKLFVIDDCSKDKTYEICKSNNIPVIKHPLQSGNGMFTISTYLKLAYQENFDIVIQIDGDNQHKAKYIPLLYKEIISGRSNIVIGSRFKNKSKLSQLSTNSSNFDRILGNLIISLFLKVFFEINISDSTSGFRAYDKKAIKALYDISIEASDNLMFYSLLKRNGLELSEIEVTMRDRTEGISEFTLIKKFLYIPSLFFNMIFTLIKKDD